MNAEEHAVSSVKQGPWRVNTYDTLAARTRDPYILGIHLSSHLPERIA